MTLLTLLLFGTVAFIAIATPGPTVLLALANGSRYGVRLALWGMLGAVLSDFVLVGAVALGLGALLRLLNSGFQRSSGWARSTSPGWACACCARRRL